MHYNEAVNVLKFCAHDMTVLQGFLFVTLASIANTNIVSFQYTVNPVLKTTSK